jgi:hypothetical protein
MSRGLLTYFRNNAAKEQNIIGANFVEILRGSRQDETGFVEALVMAISLIQGQQFISFTIHHSWRYLHKLLLLTFTITLLQILSFICELQKDVGVNP